MKITLIVLGGLWVVGGLLWTLALARGASRKSPMQNAGEKEAVGSISHPASQESNFLLAEDAFVAI